MLDGVVSIAVVLSRDESLCAMHTLEMHNHPDRDLMSLLQARDATLERHHASHIRYLRQQSHFELGTPRSNLWSGHPSLPRLGKGCSLARPSRRHAHHGRTSFHCWIFGAGVLRPASEASFSTVTTNSSSASAGKAAVAHPWIWNQASTWNHENWGAAAFAGTNSNKTEVQSWCHGEFGVKQSKLSVGHSNCQWPWQ